MRIILLLGLLGITSIVFTQAPNIEWQKCLGGSDKEPLASNTPNYIQKSKDGGYILISDTGSGDGDVTNFLGGDVWGGDLWIVKLESTGDIQWQRCLGGGVLRRRRKGGGEGAREQRRERGDERDGCRRNSEGKARVSLEGKKKLATDQRLPSH